MRDLQGLQNERLYRFRQNDLDKDDTRNLQVLVDEKAYPNAK